jgi:hypothetical protein
MPKPVVHHIHLTAAPHIDFLVKNLTYHDYVYYNQKLKMIKVYPKGFHEDGYIKTTVLRKHTAKPLEFDAFLKNEMLLNEEDIKSKESEGIWKNFQ